MADSQQIINYPDILGFVTDGKRLNIDVVQCAVTTRPDQVHAGQHFEILCLIQNTADIDIDVTVEMKLPNRDQKRNRNMFFSKSSRLLVGLHPAEMGYIVLPASCSPQTAPGKGYEIAVSVKVDYVDKTRKPRRVRGEDGGGRFNPNDLELKVKEQLKILRQGTWEVDGRRNTLTLTFDVLPKGLASLNEFDTAWRSLWSMQDYVDEYVLAQRLQSELEVFMAQLDKEAIFKPLLKATQTQFSEAGYPLKLAEAIYIAKIMTLYVCDVPIPRVTKDNKRPAWSNWYVELLKVLMAEPRYKDYAPKVIAEKLFSPLLQDAILHSFKMITTVTEQKLGTEDEHQAYAQGILMALENKNGLKFRQVYMPLIGAGIISNTRVSMSRENPKETITAMHTAYESRLTEQSEENKNAFDIIKRLIDRQIEIEQA